MNDVIIERLKKLREQMKLRNIDYYIMPTSDYHNSEYSNDFFKVREYFSGFTGSNGTLLVSANNAGLWTDGRYFIQAEKELEGTTIDLFRMQEEGVPTILEYLADSVLPGQTVGFDGRVIEVSFGKKLENEMLRKKASINWKYDLAQSVWKDRPSLPANPIRVLPNEVSGKDSDDKIREVRGIMEKLNARYFVLSKLDDLMWLFNIRGEDIECNPVALSYGLITMDEVYLFVQKEEITGEFSAYAENKNIIIKEYDTFYDFLSKFDFNGQILIDDQNTNYLLFKILSGKSELVVDENPTELLKAVKNPTELARIRDAYIKDSVAVTKFIYWIKKNIGKIKISEIDAADYIDHLRSEIPGFLDLSFPTISAYQENAAMMHYEATPEQYSVLKPEGLLLVDSGGQYMGGTTDVTRTIVLGPVSDEIKKHYSATASGMLQLLNAKFLYGCSGRNLDILARKPLWDMNIDYKCGTGHGIGYILNVHEGPQSIRWRFSGAKDEAVLQEGMIVSDEPGVYIEGSHGIRIENILAVKKDVKNGDGQFMKFEPLTFVPLDPEAIDAKYLSEEDLKNINSYQKNVYEKISPYLNEEENLWLKNETRPV